MRTDNKNNKKISQSIKTYTAVIFGCFLFTPALANLLENGALDQINNCGAIGLAGFNINYQELNIAPAKSTETGTLIGPYFDIRKTFGDIVYTDLYLDYYTGKLTFDGALQDDNYTPWKSKYIHTFFNSILKLGVIGTVRQSVQFIPYAGIGYRYWDRLQNNSLMEERYINYKAIGGLKINLLLGDDFIFSPYAEGGKIFHATMKMLGSTNHNQKATLGSKPIYTAGLEINYRAFDEFFINLFGEYNTFKFGKSPEYYGSDGHLWDEPESKTREIKFGIGIKYSWQVDG